MNLYYYLATKLSTRLRYLRRPLLYRLGTLYKAPLIQTFLEVSLKRE